MGWSLVPLLMTQGLWAAWRTPRLRSARGADHGFAGQGPALRMLALGDSIIAGVGVDRTDEALPAQLAGALARRCGWAIHWEARGRNGARSEWLLAQLGKAELCTIEPQLVVINNGINDITRPQGEDLVLTRIESVLDAAEARFPKAVICQLGLPPLGAFPALPQPLRQVLGARSERIGRRLRQRVHQRAGVHHLAFDAVPDPAQFAADGYHPAADAVALWADALAQEMASLLNSAEAGPTHDSGAPQS